MKGVLDASLEAAMKKRLEEGPAPVVDLLEAARYEHASATLGREGLLHAILLRLVASGAVVPRGHGPDGGSIYARAEEPPSTHVEGSAPIPPPVSPATSRASLAVAAGIADQETRGRVVSDVIAHRASLEAKGRGDEFGSVKAARTALSQVLRSPSSIVLPADLRERTLRFVRQEGPSLLGTMVVLFLLWYFVAEFRVVPSNSMLPTLRPGDRLLVRKAWGKSEPDRWKVVVFHRKDDGVVLVKRVVGLPGDRLAIDDGDLVVDGAISVKPDAVREAVREPLVRSTFDAQGRSQGWEPTGEGSLRRYDRPLWADEPAYPDEHGRLEPNPRPGPLAHDLYVTADVDGPSLVRLRFPKARGGPFTLEWNRPGEGSAPASSAGERTIVVESPAARDGKGRETVTVSVVDGIARIDSGSVHLRQEVDAAGGHAEVEVAGAVRNVSIDRDVHYTNAGQIAADPGTEYRVPEGHLFMMGDHSAHSRDSRYREVGPVPLEALVGPVVFRVWPPSRIGPVH